MNKYPVNRSGLVAWFDGHDYKDGITLRDRSGNNNIATMIGFTSNSPDKNGGISFPLGTSLSVPTLNNTSFPQEAVTIEICVNVGNIQDKEGTMLFDTRNASRQHIALMMRGARKLSIYCQDINNNDVALDPILPIAGNARQYISIIIVPGEASLTSGYVQAYNHTLGIAGSVRIWLNDSTWTPNAQQFNISGSSGMVLYSIRIYNRALSKHETYINYLADGGNDRPNKPYIENFNDPNANQYSTSPYLVTEFTSPLQSHSWAIVNDPKPDTSNSRGKVNRFELHNTDPDSTAGRKRIEYRLGGEQINEEHWYSIDILLPDAMTGDGTEDYIYDKADDTVFQIHYQIDPNGIDTGSSSGNSMCILTKQGTWQILRTYVADNPVVGATLSENYEYINLGDYSHDKGRWVNWKLHAKWGWLSEHNPIFEVYKNNFLVINRNGQPNTTNDYIGSNVRFGMYKYAWNGVGVASLITKRVIYHANFKLYDGNVLNITTPPVVYDYVNNISDIEVLINTTLNDVQSQLPSIVTITNTNLTTVQKSVIWNLGIPVYSPSTYGTYVFTGIIDDTDLVAKINILIPLTINSINSIADISVVYGTLLSEIGLPPTVSVVMADNSIEQKSVIWDGGNPAYAGTEGLYTFTGAVVNTTLLATIKVVEDAIKQTTVTNLLMYNHSTYEEWWSTNGVCDSTGINLLGNADWVDAFMTTTLAVSTKYGILYNVVSSALSNNLYLNSTSAFPFAILSKTVGNQKIVVTSNATILSNKIDFGIYNTETSINQININNIRVYLLPKGSQVEYDFANLTSNQLDAKYPLNAVTTIVTSGLVAQLDGADFTNSPKTITWEDKSGNNNNGIPSGFAYTNVSGSNGSDSVVFSGDNDTVSIANSASLQLTTGLTLESVFTMSVLPTSEEYIMGKNSYNDYKFSIKSTGLLNFTLTTTTSTDANTSVALVVGTKYHIVCTYDGANMKIYKNGVLVTTVAKTGTIHTSTNALTIGSNRTSLYFNGTIRSSRIYNRALTQAEITQNYNSGV